MMLNSKFSNKTNTSVRDKKILPIKLFVSIIINQIVSPPRQISVAGTLYVLSSIHFFLILTYSKFGTESFLPAGKGVLITCRCYGCFSNTRLTGTRPCNKWWWDENEKLGIVGSFSCHRGVFRTLSDILGATFDIVLKTLLVDI